jgi:hypothetical protein
MAGKICHNHTNVPAVSKCDTCSKPLCADCILEVKDIHFCCTGCAGIGLDKRERITASTVLNSEQLQSEGAACRTKLIILLILAGLAYAGYVYWHNNQVKMGKLRNKNEEQQTLQNVQKTTEATGTTEDSVTK